MFRNLKALGLALVAVFAMGGVAASAASAQQGKLTSDGAVTLDVTEIAGKLNVLTAFGGTTECAGSVGTGHKYVSPSETEELKETGKEFQHQLIPSGVTTFTGTADINQATCKVVEGGTVHKMTITMNGCDSVFHIGNTINTNQYSGTGSIVCPPGKHIQEDIYAFAGSELGGVACTLTVKEQIGLTGPVITTDTVNDDLTIEGTVTGIKISKSGFGCASEETNSGEAHVNVTVKGTNEVKNATGITITD